MTETHAAPTAPLARALASGRIHSGYLLAGPGEAPREAALAFARALVCEAPTAEAHPCEACLPCRRSAPGEPIPLDGAGKKGPLLRHVGDHPDLLWLERGAEDTRVRIAQVRALQSALRLRGGARRAAVIADADWMNAEAQNACLRLLEEPPPGATLLLVAASPEGLLATVRSRCLRVAFPARPAAAPETDAPERERLEGLARADDAAVLDWAEEFRGARAPTAAALEGLLDAASAWLHERATGAVRAGRRDVGPALEAFAALQRCRRSLRRRNANPQMVAERALFALRDAGAP